jgi:hypothetical protein
MRGGAVDNAKSILDRILADAAKWKPAGYDAAVALRRDYYNDSQTSHLRAELAKRYPHSYDRMSPYVVPLFRHLVEQMATIYRAAPRRVVVDNDEQTSLVSQLYDGAQANKRLARLESISAAARLAFLRVGFDDVERRIDLLPYWPDRVHVIFDPDRPTSLRSARCLLAEIVSDEGVEASVESRRFELWSHNDGAWYRSVVDGRGNVVDYGDVYPLLPWVALPFDLPDGGLYAMPPSDDIAVNDAVNCLNTDLLWAVSQQAWPTAWYSGPRPERDIVMGPGVLLSAGEAGQFNTLNYNPQIEAVDGVVEKLVSRHLVLRSVSPGAASADPRYESGVALKVQQQPMLERREARIPAAQEMEERDLWPLMRAMAPLAIGRAIPDDVSIRWYPGEIAMPLDDEAAFRLSKERVSAGVTTWPEEMVTLGLSPNVDEAKHTYEINTGAAEEEQEPVAVGGGAPGMAAAPASTGGVDVASQTLNGAQVESLVGVIGQVVAGQLPRDTALAILQVAFALSVDDANKILGSVGRGFEPASVEVPPNGGAKI